MEQLLLQDNVMIIHNTYIGALYNRLVCRLSFPCCVPVAWCEKLYCAIHHNLWTVLKLVKKHSNNNVHMCIWPKCPSMLFESICRAFDNVHGKYKCGCVCACQHSSVYILSIPSRTVYRMCSIWQHLTCLCSRTCISVVRRSVY